MHTGLYIAKKSAIKDTFAMEHKYVIIYKFYEQLSIFSQFSLTFVNVVHWLQRFVTNLHVVEVTS